MISRPTNIFLEGEKSVYNNFHFHDEFSPLWGYTFKYTHPPPLLDDTHTFISIHAPFFEMKWWCSLFFSDASCSLSFCWALSPLPLPKTQLYYMGGPLGARLVFGWKPNIGSHSSVWNNTVTVCIITTRLSQELLWSLWMIGGSVIVSCLALFERPGNHDDLVPFLVRYIMFIMHVQQYRVNPWQHLKNRLPTSWNHLLLLYVQ